MSVEKAENLESGCPLIIAAITVPLSTAWYKSAVLVKITGSTLSLKTVLTLL